MSSGEDRFLLGGHFSLEKRLQQRGTWRGKDVGVPSTLLAKSDPIRSAHPMNGFGFF